MEELRLGIPGPNRDPPINPHELDIRLKGGLDMSEGFDWIVGVRQENEAIEAGLCMHRSSHQAQRRCYLAIAAPVNSASF